jgi:hypothetical protein
MRVYHDEYDEVMAELRDCVEEGLIARHLQAGHDEYDSNTKVIITGRKFEIVLAEVK